MSQGGVGVGGSHQIGGSIPAGAGGQQVMAPGAFLMPGMSPSPNMILRPASSLSMVGAPGTTAHSASPNLTSSNSTTPNPTISSNNLNNININTNNNVPPAPRMPIFSNGRPELPPPRWYDASVPLGVSDDKYYLSELQCVLRQEFVETFGTTQTDIVLPVYGRNKPIALGQVGIRCQHCKYFNANSLNNGGNGDANNERTNRINAQNAISYPSFVSNIYNTVQQMYRLHFDQCPHVPAELKQRVANLKDSHTSNRGGRKQYWMDSAKRIGLVDTSFGIHYGRDPTDRLPPLGGGEVDVRRRTSPTSSILGGEDGDNDEYNNEWRRGVSHGSNSPEGSSAMAGIVGSSSIQQQQMEEQIEIYPLVLPEDKPLISDYLYLALEQMQPCNLMDADRVGCYKGRRTGFPGLACRHCIGQAGCGRYFPASEASLSQTTTSQTIVNHVRNCRRCPMEMREQLELMKRAKTCPDYKKKSDKPKHGGRKVFFHRLWCRIQRIPLPKNEKASASGGAPGSPETQSSPSSPGGKEKKSTTTTPSDSGSPERKKKRKKSVDGSEKKDDKHRKSARRSLDKYKIDYDDHGSDSDLEDNDEGAVETVEFDNVHHNDEGSIMKSPSREPTSTATIAASAANERSQIIYQGRTRLTRHDDPHWLSESDCFIRQELTEIFTATTEDLELYGDPEIGQVGVRCFYCAENKAVEDRGRGHVYYPRSVGGVQQAVSDLQRRHLGMCSEIPEHIRKTFQSMKAKPRGDTAQYWTDAAKELGLHDSHEGQGISFFRNPLDHTPADVLDMENNDDAPTGSILVPAVDRSKCTDHMLFLLKQFEPCQFRTSDRKSSRSRDRALGYPGLFCIHCKQKRYFPMTEKKLQDSLSLMTTHVNNCFHAPLDVKASLGYLHHRSFLQKQELSGQWKFTFLKGVWNRLHKNNVGGAADSAAVTDADTSTTTMSGGHVKDVEGKEETNKALPEEEDAPIAESGSTEEEEIDALDNHVSTELSYDNSHEGVGNEEQDPPNELGEMKDMIKAAALWLTERDAEYEVRGGGGGRIRGIKRR